MRMGAQKCLCAANGALILALYSKFIFPERRIFLVLGGWVGGLAWVGGFARSAPLPTLLWLSTFLIWMTTWNSQHANFGPQLPQPQSIRKVPC